MRTAIACPTEWSNLKFEASLRVIARDRHSDRPLRNVRRLAQVFVAVLLGIGPLRAGDSDRSSSRDRIVQSAPTRGSYCATEVLLRFRLTSTSLRSIRATPRRAVRSFLVVSGSIADLFRTLPRPLRQLALVEG